MYGTEQLHVCCEFSSTRPPLVILFPFNKHSKITCGWAVIINFAVSLWSYNLNMYTQNLKQYIKSVLKIKNKASYFLLIRLERESLVSSHTSTSNLINEPKLFHTALTEEVLLTIFNDSLLEPTRTAFKCDKPSVSDMEITSQTACSHSKELGMLNFNNHSWDCYSTKFDYHTSLRTFLE